MDDTETETSRTTKEVTVVYEQGVFVHSTGDAYDGYFEAKKKDRSVKMHGAGVYTTAEGDTYSGTWDAGTLGGTDDVTINYIDGSTYVGRFKEWCYSGRGTYRYPDNSVVQGEFVNNAPIGNLVLTDPNGHQWLGKAERSFAWLEPVNHYYDMLDMTKDSKKNIRKNQRL